MLGKLAAAVLVVGGTAFVRSHVRIMLQVEPDVQKWNSDLVKASGPVALKFVRDKPMACLADASLALLAGFQHGLQETVEYKLLEKNTGV